MQSQLYIRQGAMAVWPGLLGGQRGVEQMILASLQELNRYSDFDGIVAALSTMDAWREAGWIVYSPNGLEIRLTAKGEEQFAVWHEEDRLWASGNRDAPEMPKRLKAGQPATNLRRICAVVGNRTISCIHDPYTDEKSLENLLKLKGLGLQISPDLKVLGAPKATIALTIVGKFLRDLNAENKSQWEMRTYSDRPHRRFTICSGGSVVTFGLSLNNLNKDEVLESIPAGDPHAEHDCEFFEEKWKIAIPLPR